MEWGISAAIVGVLTLFWSWNSGHRRLKNGPLYILKWVLSWAYVRFYLRTTKSTIRTHDDKSDDIHVFGILPSPLVEDLEKPQDLTSRGTDSMHFAGRDASGHSVLLRVTRRHGRQPEVWLALDLGEKEKLQLPLQPNIKLNNVYKVYNGKESSFRAKGLNFEVLEPMHRWRVAFNGLLRKGLISLEDGDGQVVPVHFSFIWTAFTEPFDYKNWFSPYLWADALAHNFCNGQQIDKIKTFVANRYEQWGQLKGILSVEGEEDLELHLWGLRQHAFGNSIWEDVDHLVELEAYITDGTLIRLGAAAFQKGPASFSYGLVNEASGVVSSVTWTNLTPEQTLSKVMTIQLDAGGQSHKLQLTLPDSSWKMPKGGVVDSQTIVHQVAFDFNGKKGFGWLNYSNRKEVKDSKEEIHSFSYSVPEIDNQDGSDALVLPLNSPACRLSKLVGGKGASLAWLTFLQNKMDPTNSAASIKKDSRAEMYQVPKAICVTAKAFFDHLAESPCVQQAIRQLEDVAWKKIDGSVQEECERVVEALRTSQLPEKIQSSISVEFLEIFKDYQGTFAVRSSAIGEDSEDTSAAGQNETYLGIRDLKEIFPSIVKCWASQFTYGAVEYKRQRGQLLNPGMGVVIQEMVAPDVAGVLFTIDPVTGYDSTMTITANYGLAESVVSASAEPDTVLLNRTFDNNLSVGKKMLGAKKSKTVLKGEGGITVLEVDAKLGSRLCVSDDLALELGAIGVALELCLGQPQDVEWAVANERVYLLQARPITSSGRISDFELTHELDSPMRTSHELSTKANTGEVFPNASTPLTLSTVTRCMDIAILTNIMQRHSSVRYCPYDFGKHLVVTHNHVLMNCIDLMCRDSMGQRSLSSRVLELSVYGHELDDITMYNRAGERYAHCGSTKIGFFFDLIGILRNNESTLQQMLQEYKDFTVDTTSLLPDNLYKAINKMLPKVVKCCQFHTLVTIASAFWNLVAVIVLTENNADWSENLYTDIASLLSNCSEVESAEVPTAMQELVEVIIAEEDHKEFSELKTAEDAVQWLHCHGEKVKMTFEQFLRKHGHRCLKELDVHSKSWRMDPGNVAAILQQMVKHPSQVGPKKQSSSIQETLQQLKSPKSRRTKWILGWILPKYRAAVGYREQSKSVLVKVIDQLRLAYNILGLAMVNEGRLPDAQLLFFLTHGEIGQLLKNRSPKLVAKAIQRKRLQPQLDELRFSEVVVGIPQPQKPAAVDDNNEKSTKITGTPVCNGVAKGSARVIKKLENASEIKSGDILITYSTDIGWSPYFPLLSGVVTEIGGILSHGAVVAREYGLPCIVGAHNATNICKSGDLVLLNGTKGTLEIQMSQTCSDC